MKLDGVVYMNLARSSDRCVAMEAELKRVGLTGHRVEAVDGKKLPNELLEIFRCRVNGSPAEARTDINNVTALGLVLSNIRACNYALSQGWKRWLLLEDDALFAADFAEQFDKIGKLMPSEWSLLVLGTNPAPMDPNLLVAPGLYKMPMKMAMSYAHVWNGKAATRAWIDILSGLDVLTDKVARRTFTANFPTYVTRPCLTFQNGAVTRCKDGSYTGTRPEKNYYTPETRPNAL